MDQFVFERRLRRQRRRRRRLLNRLHGRRPEFVSSAAAIRAGWREVKSGERISGLQSLGYCYGISEPSENTVSSPREGSVKRT
jgi:hypothetical protein